MGNVGIYKILNPEGKIYIGYSTDLQRREEQYSQNNISTQILLKESINKYGWKQHKFKIIEYCDDNKLKLQEKYWIKFYKSYQNGLNMNIGGGGPIKHSKETIQKMKKPKPKGFGAVISKLKLGKPNPKLSLSKTGKPSTFMGKKHKSESIDKMSKVRKGKTYEEIFGEEITWFRHWQEILGLKVHIFPRKKNRQ